MEFHELGSLDDHLTPAPASLPESEVKVITSQVLKALNYMHELDLMHRDLKPAVRNALVPEQRDLPANVFSSRMS